MANYAPRTALLPGVMDTISPDEHKYFFVFATDVDNTTNVRGLHDIEMYIIMLMFFVMKL